jgi:methionine-rich copper-binding protein CopC
MRHRLITRLATIVALAVLLILPVGVMAHADLDTPTPAEGATVEGTPAAIEATFTQDVDPDGSSLQLRDADGRIVAEGGVVAGEPRRMAIDLVPELAPGEYEVRWTTFSAEDGEGPIRGTWTFTVAAEPTPEPTPSALVTDAPTTEPSIEPTTVPTVAPSPSPSGEGDPAASEGDVLLPIIAALAIVAIAGVVLLNRRGRTTGA